MNIIVLNGSPKSKNSVTLQSMNYLKLKFPDINFEIIHLISIVRKGNEEIKKISETIKSSDAIIWSFPLYHLLVPSHMKEFIEKVFDLKLEGVFAGKYATAYTTSIHFYDNTAHDYIEGISDDLNMKYIQGLSHDMFDFLEEEKRLELKYFFDDYFNAIKENEIVVKRFKPITDLDYKYAHTITKEKVKTSKQTVIVTDSSEDTNVDHMIQKFASSIDGSVKVINLNNIDISHYCIGCCNCAFENECVFHDKDDYRKTLDEIIDDSDIIVFAAKLKDRYFSSRFKLFFDRSFCYTHIPIFSGRQIAFLVSGSVSEIPHMHEIMYSYGTSSSNYVGMLSDECRDSKTLDILIENLAKKCVKYSEDNFIKSGMFQSVAAKKIFADFVRSSHAGIFICDYDYYKKHGYYKKPSIFTKISTAVFRSLMRLKPVSTVAKKDMYRPMVNDHKKVLEAEQSN